MNNNIHRSLRSILILLAAVSLVGTSRTFAHCDTMNGPVVKAAEKALETGNVAGVLMWVAKKDETEIREAFARTLSVRKLNPEAKRLADIWFFETLVRIHRAGEGVAFTGLKPADTKVDHGIAAADESLEKGTTQDLLKDLTEAVHRGIQSRFTEVLNKKSFKQGNVEAGREFVKAYVQFIHYIERLHQAATTNVEGHYHEPGQTTTHDDRH